MKFEAIYKKYKLLKNQKNSPLNAILLIKDSLYYSLQRKAPIMASSCVHLCYRHLFLRTVIKSHSLIFSNILYPTLQTLNHRLEIKLKLISEHKKGERNSE